jgi:excisionase family DNA binding protein
VTETLLGLARAARELGVGIRVVRQLTADGWLPSARFGDAIVIRRADVDRLAADGWPGRRHPASTAFSGVVTGVMPKGPSERHFPLSGGGHIIAAARTAMDADGVVLTCHTIVEDRGAEDRAPTYAFTIVDAASGAFLIDVEAGFRAEEDVFAFLITMSFMRRSAVDAEVGRVVNGEVVETRTVLGPRHGF